MKHGALLFTMVTLAATLVFGIVLSLAITLLKVTVLPNATVGAAYITLLGVLLIVVLVEVISVFKIDDSTLHTVLLALSLFMLYAFSTDMQLFFAYFGIGLPRILFGIASEVLYVCASIFCCWYLLFLYGVPINIKIVAAYVAPLLGAIIGYSVALVYGFGYIAHFAMLVMTVAAFLRILFVAEGRRENGITTYFIAATFSLSAGVQSVNALTYSGVTAAVPGLSLTYAILTVAVFLCVYLAFSIRTDGKAMKSSEYKHQAELFETRALSEQIKPHFIFNSLEAVRTLYHQDIASGDAAVNYLSDFLRGSIRSFDSELVPFETEIDNIFSYTEFEKLKRPDTFEVIFDIDYTDFCVPPFSLQPFAENAIKHSGVGDMENGRIIISSYKDGDSAVVEISDNGKGFEPAKISEQSHGIKNACGRFLLALGTAPVIESVLGEGTRVRIVIDLKREGVKKA